VSAAGILSTLEIPEDEAMNLTDAPKAESRRGLKAAVAATLAVTGTLTFLAATKSAPAVPAMTREVLAESALPAATNLTAHGETDVQIVKVTVRPGGSTPWHSHGGPVLVSVTEGTATNYVADGSSCSRHAYKAGQGVVETPGTPHSVRNEGKTDLVFHVVFLIPNGGDAGTPERHPADCPAPGKEV
jgi:quercetin dioxygenase-like cupin family protein